jgi:hypothetical protein
MDVTGEACGEVYANEVACCTSAEISNPGIGRYLNAKAGPACHALCPAECEVAVGKMK